MPWSAPCCHEKESKLRSRTVSKGSTTQQHGVIEQFPSFLPEIPLCVLAVSCNGTAASGDVDHKIRAEQHIANHQSDETFFLDPENLQGACHACQQSQDSGAGHAAVNRLLADCTLITI
jgi:hypothetical protein